jgi:predicted ATPase
LHDWLDKALQGERQIVFVTGEPGIGKTTVVEAFLIGIRDWGLGVGSASLPTTILTPPVSGLTLNPNPQSPTPSPWIGRGQCIEHYGAGEAYLPVLEAFGRLCREPGGERLVSLLTQYAPTWMVQLPSLLSDTEYDVLQRKTLGATRERMLREMAEAIEVLTIERPLILWLEDLHWSDVSTLDLLSLLARRPERARLLILGTYRPVEILGNGHPLRAVTQELHAHRQCEELRLGLLTEEDVTTYLVQQVATEVVREPSLQKLASTVYRRTEGNPLFMVNMVKYLLAQGAFAHDSEHVLAELQSQVVPESLQPMIERQLERLNPAERQMLEVASVAGMDFSAAAVAVGLGTESGEVEMRCAELVRSEQFLQAKGTSEWPDGTVAARFGFTHALYQNVLYERVTAGRRVQMHRQIGERIEAGYGEQTVEVAAELAVHFERGRDYRRAVQYLQYAGERALRRYAHQEAIGHLTKALELLHKLPDTPERNQQELALQTALGPAYVAMQGWGATEVGSAYTRARELCRQMGDSPQLAPVLYGLWTFYVLRAEHETGLELAEQLFTLAQRTHDPVILLESHTAMGVSLLFFGEFAQAQEHLEQGTILYNPQQHSSLVFLYGIDPGVLCFSLVPLTQWLLGYPDHAAKCSHEALSLAEELSHPFNLVYAQYFAAVLYQLCREGPTAQQWTEAEISLCRKQGFTQMLAMGTSLRGWALAEQEQREEGIAQLRQGLAAFRATGAELWRPYYLALLAEALEKSGQLAVGMTTIEEALAIVNKNGERLYEAELYRIKGELLLAQEGFRPQAEGLREKAKEEGVRLQAEDLREKTGEAEGCFLRAIEIARKQQAKSLELRAVTSLSCLWQQLGKVKQAHTMLSEIYHWFTEGFETTDLREAKTLLEELQG